jgi:hypothetical protein
LLTKKIPHFNEIVRSLRIVFTVAVLIPARERQEGNPEALLVSQAKPVISTVFLSYGLSVRRMRYLD